MTSFESTARTATGTAPPSGNSSFSTAPFHSDVENTTCALYSVPLAAADDGNAPSTFLSSPCGSTAGAGHMVDDAAAVSVSSSHRDGVATGKATVAVVRVDGAVALRRLLTFQHEHFPETEAAAEAAALPLPSRCAEQRLSAQQSGSSYPSATADDVPPAGGSSSSLWAREHHSDTQAGSAVASPRVSPTSSAGYVFPSAGASLSTFTPPALRGQPAPALLGNVHVSPHMTRPPPPAAAATAESQTTTVTASPTGHQQLQPEAHWMPPASGRPSWPHPRPAGPWEASLLRSPCSTLHPWAQPQPDVAPVPSSAQALSPSPRALFPAEPPPLSLHGDSSSTGHAWAGSSGQHGRPFPVSRLTSASNSSSSSGWWVRPHQHSNQLRYASDDAPWLALHRNECVPVTQAAASPITAAAAVSTVGMSGSSSPAPEARPVTMVEVGSLYPCPLYEQMLLTGNHADVVLAVTQKEQEEAEEEEGSAERRGGLAAAPCKETSPCADGKRVVVVVTLFRAHRAVLANMSPFFDVLLYHSGDGSAGEAGGGAELVHVRTLQPKAGTVRKSDRPGSSPSLGGSVSAMAAYVPVIDLSPRPPVPLAQADKERGDATAHGASPSPPFPLTPTLLADILLYIYTGKTSLVGLVDDGGGEDRSSGPRHDPTSSTVLLPSQLAQRHGVEFVHTLWASEYFMLPTLTACLYAALPDFLAVTSVWPVLQEARHLGLCDLVQACETWTRQHVWDLISDTSGFLELEPDKVATLLRYHRRRLAFPVPGDGGVSAGRSRWRRRRLRWKPRGEEALQQTRQSNPPSDNEPPDATPPTLNLGAREAQAHPNVLEASVMGSVDRASPDARSRSSPSDPGSSSGPLVLGPPVRGPGESSFPLLDASTGHRPLALSSASVASRSSHRDSALSVSGCGGGGPAATFLYIAAGGIVLGPANPPRVRMLTTHSLQLPCPRLWTATSAGARAAAASVGPVCAAVAMRETDVMAATLLWVAAWRQRVGQRGNGEGTLASAIASTVGALCWEAVEAELIEREVLPLVREFCPDVLATARRRQRQRATAAHLSSLSDGSLSS